MTTKKLTDMTKEELIAFAKEQGIPVDQRASKATILETVTKATATAATETATAATESATAGTEPATAGTETATAANETQNNDANPEENQVEDELETGEVLGGGITQLPTVTSNKVVVASNFPSRLKFRVPTRSGTQEVVIMGNAENLRGKDKGILPTSGAFGITVLDSEVWEAIEKNYSNFPAIKNGLIFAANSSASVKSEVANRQDLKNGLEPIDPDKTLTKPN